jgi:hypothetical protein
MEPGNLYRVTYKQQSGNGRWYRWEMTAVYLGPAGEYRPGYEEFSLRPQMGSTSLRANLIEAADLVERDIPHKYRNGVRDRALRVKLPRRYKGAVEAPA